MIRGEIEAGYTPTADLRTGQLKSFKDMNNKNKYALGGILQGAQLGMNALGVLDQMLTQQKVPMQMDNNSFNYGGDLPLSSDAVQIKGKGGVDTNRRMINGKPFYFSKEEVIKDDFVYSNAVKDEDGKTFAKKAQKIEKSSGRAEKRLKLNTSDLMAQSTIRRNNERMEHLAQKQEAVKAKTGKSNIGGAKIQMRFNDGGSIDYNARNLPTAYDTYKRQRRNDDLELMQGIANKANNPILAKYNETNFEDLAKNRGYEIQFQRKMYPPNVLQPLDPNQQRIETQRNYLGDVKEMSEALPKPSRLKEEGLSFTPGDKMYMAGKGIELLSKGIMAAQPAQQISSRPFEVDPQRISATPALQANTRNYRSAVQNINTGNAAIDRVSKANLFGAKTQADTQALTQAQAANRQAKLQTDQYNSQVRQRIEQANAQSLGAKQNMMDNLFSSIGEAGRIAQDAFNTKATNNIRLQSLNGLSQYFGVSTEYLRSIMKSNPVQFDKMMVEFKQNSNNG
jgi:hypothetical protein